MPRSQSGGTHRWHRWRTVQSRVRGVPPSREQRSEVAPSGECAVHAPARTRRGDAIPDGLPTEAWISVGLPRCRRTVLRPASTSPARRVPRLTYRGSSRGPVPRRRWGATNASRPDRASLAVSTGQKAPAGLGGPWMRCRHLRADRRSEFPPRRQSDSGTASSVRPISAMLNACRDSTRTGRDPRQTLGSGQGHAGSSLETPSASRLRDGSENVSSILGRTKARAEMTGSAKKIRGRRPRGATGTTSGELTFPCGPTASRTSISRNSLTTTWRRYPRGRRRDSSVEQESPRLSSCLVSWMMLLHTLSKSVLSRRRPRRTAHFSHHENRDPYGFVSRRSRAHEATAAAQHPT